RFREVPGDCSADLSCPDDPDGHGSAFLGLPMTVTGSGFAYARSKSVPRAQAPRREARKGAREGGAGRRVSRNVASVSRLERSIARLLALLARPYEPSAAATTNAAIFCGSRSFRTLPFSCPRSCGPAA